MIDIFTKKQLTAFEFLLTMKPCLPQTQEGKKIGSPSNAEIRRWLDQGAVLINGVKPKAKDKIQFPIQELVFFPKNQKKRTTIF